ncbi:hypothetical protein VP01_3752g1 [Puccinia sorghi]|uniref:Uncharacterized protein n=1 Tax=Puccinia sorghi TaxID=27349 RepID=A0A0L6UUN0_9BASI|nr:hypothetical protein VP01_3752g1 [Puccinia sorghi]
MRLLSCGATVSDEFKLHRCKFCDSLSVHLIQSAEGFQLVISSNPPKMIKSKRAQRFHFLFSSSSSRRGTPAMARPHTPPASSPLVTPGKKFFTVVPFGDKNCDPKYRTLLNLRIASRRPSLTASATHSYRFTKEGIVLMACVDKDKLMDHRMQPSAWIPPPSPST